MYAVKSLAVQGSQMLEVSPWEFSLQQRTNISYLWKMPWDTVEFLLRFLDCAFQSTVGEGVALVEVKIAFISKEAVSSLRC